jgi:Bardet-Biedl syndrome 1 protein
VASGPYIYVYKNLRPYFKFTLPSLPINQLEQDLWNQVREDQIDVNILREMLDGIRQEGSQGSLTVRSLRFLQLHPSDLSAFANLYKHTPLKKQTVITCLQTMKKSLADDDAVSCLVLGTESKAVYILDPEAFTVLATMSLPSVPVLLHVSGLYDVEFRVIVACRDGAVYVVRRGNTAGKQLFALNSHAVGLEKVNKTIVVAGMDQTLQGYSTKGRSLWSVNLPAKVLSMGPMDYAQRGYQAVFVGLANSELHIYNEKFLVHVMKTEDIITGMKFGQFGRESSALILTTRGGGLSIKILKRNATFEGKEATLGPPAAQNTRLNVPKKTKLFVDQTMRERQNCISMHRRFQQDLYLLRLKTAREYVKVNSMIRGTLNG